MICVTLYVHTTRKTYLLNSKKASTMYKRDAFAKVVISTVWLEKIVVLLSNMHFAVLISQFVF